MRHPCVSHRHKTHIRSHGQVDQNLKNVGSKTRESLSAQNTLAHIIPCQHTYAAPHLDWPVSRFSITVLKTMRPNGSKASRRAADSVRKDRLPTNSL